MWNFAQQYQAIVDQALKGYETFHKVPQGTATVEQVESSSAGIEGFARYMDAEMKNLEALESLAQAEGEGKQTVTDKPHIDLLTRVGTNSISVVGPKTE